MKARLAMTLLRRYGPALAAVLAARAATAKGRPGARRPATGSLARTLGRLASELRRR